MCSWHFLFYSLVGAGEWSWLTGRALRAWRKWERGSGAIFLFNLLELILVCLLSQQSFTPNPYQICTLGKKCQVPRVWCVFVGIFLTETWGPVLLSFIHVSRRKSRPWRGSPIISSLCKYVCQLQALSLHISLEFHNHLWGRKKRICDPRFIDKIKRIGETEWLV